MEYENTEVKRLRDKLEAGILAQVPRSFVTGDPDNRLPNTSNIAFEFIEGEAILLLLNKVRHRRIQRFGLYFGSLEPSHVMRAMGIPYTAAHGTVRFSLSRYNTEDGVDRVIGWCRRSSRSCASCRRTGKATVRWKTPKRRSRRPTHNMNHPEHSTEIMPYWIDPRPGPCG